ncbi:hypothetical protein SMGD1_1527 [Sulfurimonas gotlandica GD1]|uniref:Protein containing DUF945, bacterial n=1 Tax=Sulfurimonas gotlandica (strain DSM 19862 / JCM 16533 / GD1) TaxID=929558 RepID=B6BHQ2_SULGG|nr:DUF945 family protein [Sulfurimonas gotlandica]EDZ63464.1 hypothetical protein CBGD1_1084 [Sulfurimonas gotlandica GD1]EHP30051.1 hypothetical protein SMGD1_1527 [Sulfurimonas gotlandica GD1]
MKKILIALIVIVGVIALLPIVGNKVADEVLNERVSLLTSNGLELKNDVTESSYLSTKKHYEFLLSDAPKFIEYLNQYSDAQIPPYIEAMISGVVVGVDIEHSNFPLSSKLLVDIYPLTLPTTITDELKQENLDFYNYIDKLLQGKGVLYHMNYYIADGLFDGYIKNIDAEYTFDNGSKMIFQLLDATYYGDGTLIAPKNLQTSISKILIRADESGKGITFEINDLTSASTFESQSTYASSAAMKSMSIVVQDAKSSKVEAAIEDIKVNISSNTQGKKAEFYVKSSLAKMKINSKDANIVASGFNYDLSLNGVDKDSYEEFRILTSHVNANYSPDFEQKIQASVTKLLSKGLSLSVADLSMKKILIENKKTIDGFSIMARIVLKEDSDLAKKLKSSPMSIANNLNIASTIKFSKDFYALVNKEAPITSLAGGLAREDGNNLVFEIKLNNGKLTVNEKAIN